MSAVDRSPTRYAGALSLLAGGAAVFVPGVYSVLALAVGVAGALTLTIGLVAARQAGVTGGATAIFAGVFLAGVEGAPALVLLVGAAAAILAWDSATTAICLGEQLGQNAATRRVELVHTGLTGAVGVASVVLAYGIFTVVAWNATLTGVLLLVLAVVVLAAAFR